MIYFVIALLLFYLLYNYDVCSRTCNKNLWYNILLIIFILFAGLRFRVGGDTLGYMASYDSFTDIFKFKFSTVIDIRFQPLWSLYCSVLKTISPSFVLLQFANATIINCVIFSFARKHSQYPFTVIFFYYILYYLLFNFEIMREALAVSVFLLGFRFWEQRRWFLYYIVAFICFNIHVSAIILFILPFFRNVHISIRTFILVLIICGISAKLLLNLFLNLIDIYLPLSSGLEGNVMKYSNMIFKKESYNLNYYLLVWSESLFIPLIILTINSFKSKVKIEYPILIYLILIFAVLASLSDILFRFGNYLIIFYLIFLSDFFIYSVRRFLNLRIVFISFFVLLLMFQILFNFNKSLYGTEVKGYKKNFPYYSLFNPKKDPGREGILTHK